MGPRVGTSEYKEQVVTIVTALGQVPMEPQELPMFLMMYITDRTYSRAAICQAEKEIKIQRGWNLTGV